MKIEEALTVLDGCKWLKLSASSVSACQYRSTAENAMLSREDWLRLGRDAIYKANVHIRRGKGESFEALLIRAATLVRSGHVPKRRVPTPNPQDRCACGEKSNLIWNRQLGQRVCRRCDRSWTLAALHNDMPITKGDPS